MNLHSFFAKYSDKAWCAHWFSSSVVWTSTSVFIAKLLFVVRKQKRQAHPKMSLPECLQIVNCTNAGLRLGRWYLSYNIYSMPFAQHGKQKMPPTRRQTAECYWLVEVRFRHDMGAIYRVGVFILQFPAAGKAIAGFSGDNFLAGIIVQDSLSPRIVLAAAAADVHFKPVGEFRSLAQRRTIALRFLAAKVASQCAQRTAR